MATARTADHLTTATNAAQFGCKWKALPLWGLGVNHCHVQAYVARKNYFSCFLSEPSLIELASRFFNQGNIKMAIPFPFFFKFDAPFPVFNHLALPFKTGTGCHGSEDTFMSPSCLLWLLTNDGRTVTQHDELLTDQVLGSRLQLWKCFLRLFADCWCNKRTTSRLRMSTSSCWWRYRMHLNSCFEYDIPAGDWCIGYTNRNV